MCPVSQVTIVDEGLDSWSGGEAVPFTMIVNSTSKPVGKKVVDAKISVAMEALVKVVLPDTRLVVV